MFRIRYIYEFNDVVSIIEEFLETHYHIKKQDLRNWTVAAIRGLLEHEFYFNILPKRSLRQIVHRDAFGIGIAHPGLIQRLHYQIQRPPEYAHLWMDVWITPGNDLFIEYDFRPIDYSAYMEGLPHVQDLPSQRHRARA